MTRLITIFLLSVMTQVILAQDNPSIQERTEHLKAQKIAFLTEKINLSSADAQAFWPVYNHYSSKKDSLSLERWNERTKLMKNYDRLSDKDKEKSIDRQVQLKLEEERLEFHFHQKFKNILTIDQVIKLYDAEHEFRMRLIRQIREIKARRLENNSNMAS